MIQKFYAKLSEKERAVFNVALFIVLLAFLDRLFFGPVMSKINTIDEEISNQKSSIDRDLRILSYKDKIINDNKAFGKYITENLADDDVINAAFLQTVEKLATQSSVNLIKSTPTERKDHKNSIEYYANVDCTGQLKDVVSFMHAINASEDLLKVATFSMTPKRGAANEVNASLTVVKVVVPAVPVDSAAVPAK